jgi:hypothetical protein
MAKQSSSAATISMLPMSRPAGPALIPMQVNVAALRVRRCCVTVLRHRWRWRAGALLPDEIPKFVPIGTEVGGGAIDRFQERQQIRPL